MKKDLPDIVNQINVICSSKLNADESICIFIGGSGGSGKSTFARLLSSQLPGSSVLHLDDYRLSRNERMESGLLGSNPAANKIELIIEHLKKIKLGSKFEKPVYNEVTGESIKSELYTPARYNIIDGEICFCSDLINHTDFSIYIDSSFFVQLKQRIRRDVIKRNYGLIKSLKVFWQSNIKDFKKYYKSNIESADLKVKNISSGKFKIV